MSSYENINLNWTTYQIFKKQDSFKGCLPGKRGWQWCNVKVCSWLLQESKNCNKAVDTYAHALQFVPNCFKTQNICNKAVDTHASAMQLVPDWCKTQRMCGKVVFK